MTLQEHFGTWYPSLEPLLTSKHFESLGTMVSDFRTRGTIYPDTDRVFRAFRETPIYTVKVVILGQDPYHNGIATGLAFDCAGQLYPSPSLKNILIEVETSVYGGSVDMMKPNYYDLSRWARQGVFLINSALTVPAGQPNQHAQYWKTFTSTVLNTLSKSSSYIIFMLWGKAAQAFEPVIENNMTNVILRSDHPQAPNYGRKFIDGRPLWFGNRHFAIANELLQKQFGDNAIINW